MWRRMGLNQRGVGLFVGEHGHLFPNRQRTPRLSTHAVDANVVHVNVEVSSRPRTFQNGQE